MTRYSRDGDAQFGLLQPRLALEAGFLQGGGSYHRSKRTKVLHTEKTALVLLC